MRLASVVAGVMQGGSGRWKQAKRHLPAETLVAKMFFELPVLETNYVR